MHFWMARVLHFASCSEPFPPLSPDAASPRNCITVLGGPKGIPDELKVLLQKVFSSHGAPLLEISLGSYEHMAHVCVSYIRVQDDAGRYKATLTDLLRLGPKHYAEVLSRMDKLHSNLFEVNGAPQPSSTRTVKKAVVLKRPAMMKKPSKAKVKAVEKDG